MSITRRGVLALTITAAAIGGALVVPAPAYAYSCDVETFEQRIDSAAVKCTSLPSGAKVYRVKMNCRASGGKATTRRGPLVTRGVWSRATCTSAAPQIVPGTVGPEFPLL
jgi:hypothetical protein